MKKIITLIVSLLLMLSLLTLFCAAEEASDVLSEPEAGDTAVSEEAPVFLSAVTRFFEDHASEILGILTFLSSMLVALLYKSGLLPLLRNGISALAETAGKTGKMTEVFTERAEKELADLKECAAPLTALMQKTEEYLKSMSEALAKAEANEAEMKEILAAETSLFYELLTSVNLPEAQKESMAESYYRLRLRLEKKE